MTIGQREIKDQFAGIIKWKCAGGTTASTRTSVLCAMGPIQGTNAPAKDSLPLHHIQNGGQKYNVPIHDHKLGFAPRPPLLKNEYDPPTTFEKIPIAPQAKNLAVRAPPQHVESPAPPTSSARTPHSSHPGGARLALSSAHPVVHNAAFPPGNNKGPSPDYDMPNSALANSPINVTNLAIKLRDYPLRQQAQELEDGFKFGFRLGFIGERIDKKSKNLTLALELKNWDDGKDK
jgi:hypothetical protein